MPLRQWHETKKVPRSGLTLAAWQGRVSVSVFNAAPFIGPLSGPLGFSSWQLLRTEQSSYRKFFGDP